jgi:release factor glutamine methyltransferase
MWLLDLAVMSSNHSKIEETQMKKNSLSLQAIRKLYPQADRADFYALTQYVTGWDKALQWVHEGKQLDETASDLLQSLLLRRQNGEPVAYLIGHKEFYGRCFQISPHVLIPRPETELLIDVVMAHVKQRALAQARIWDVGTGSGCVAVTLKLEGPQHELFASDVSFRALECAMNNAALLGGSIHGVQMDTLLGCGLSKLDILVSNPPYIACEDHHLTQGDLRFEPRLALTDEQDGLSIYRRLCHQVERLKPGGMMCVEHGHDQAQSVCELMHQSGLVNIQSYQDLAGILRISCGHRKT